MEEEKGREHEYDSAETENQVVPHGDGLVFPQVMVKGYELLQLVSLPVFCQYLVGRQTVLDYLF